jgi:NTE family protein
VLCGRGSICSAAAPVWSAGIALAPELGMTSSNVLGLVLTGGGARAAYQVGVLRGVAELAGAGPCPFQVVVGVSAGAINAVALAEGAADFASSVGQLAATWRALSPERVYRTDAASLARIGARLFKDLTTGGLLGPSRSNHLLDTAPLAALLRQRLSPPRLAEQIAAGRLRAVAVTATNYQTGSAVTFYQGASDLAPWLRSSRLGRPDRLTIAHVMASAAIPVFFPPAAVGGAFYGDGCIRLTAPLSPAIHLGADRVLAIGVRYPRSAEEVGAINHRAAAEPPTLSQIGGVLLNAVFLDSLDSDLERMERINGTLSAMPAEQRRRLRQPLRHIPVMALRPSRDLGRLGADRYARLPLALRHLLRGIGATGEGGWDLLSYLAFEPTYVGRLLELGYDDARAHRAELEAFLEPRPHTTPRAAQGRQD